MTGTTFQELLDGVANYYGAGSDQWAEIARFGINQQTLPIIQQVPGVTVTVSNSGKYLGYDYNNAFASSINPASVIDSNVQSGAYGTGSFNAQLPATAVTDSSTGTVTLQSGARAVSTGAMIATIADRTLLAVAGVALGTKLGKLIDSGIYAINPNWWDEHYPTINPQTWDDMSTTQGGKSFIRAIFGLENDNATMYLNERMLAYTYMMLLANGAYSSGDGYEPLNSYTPQSNAWVLEYPQAFNFPIQFITPTIISGKFSSNTWVYVPNGGDAVYIGGSSVGGSARNAVFVSDEYFTITRQMYNSSGSLIGETTETPLSTTIDNVTYYLIFLNLSSLSELNIAAYNSGNYGTWATFDVVKLFYNQIIPVIQSLDGVSSNPEASTQITPSALINPTTGQPVTENDNVDDVLQALKTQYPDLFNNSIYEDIPQDDATIQRVNYIPVPYPNTTNTAQPITDTTPGIDPQITPQVNSNTRSEPLIQQLVNTLTQTPTAPDTGNGETPSVIIPTGSANALYSIYNPTQAELNSFGAWLWSSNFVDQLLKLFNDPMQAIIGLHKVFAQPTISGASTIHVGYLDSGVSSNIVGNQYTTIDCGAVNVSEYFGNVFDYDPFTQIYIYLPFVGIEKLDTGDVMRGLVGVKYHVDVLTGACLAEITVTRDGAGGILYTFAGNCAVQYPISSGSYMGIVASLASIAGGVVGTITSGGALAPVAMGAVSGIMNAHTRVNHSGAFSGNAGAMGVKIPYLIITRPQTCLADNFPDFDGYPANKTTTLSECSGFVKCETCHIENVPATDAELSEIEMLLKDGIII